MVSRQLSRRLFFAVIALLIGVPAGFGLTGAVFCNATLRVKKTRSPTPVGAVVVSIRARDQANLSAWWMKASKPNGNCVVLLHGIKDSRASSLQFAPLFLSEGYDVLLPDIRAHGASEGQFVTYGMMEKYDVLAWADWMKDTGCQRLYALGESLGAAV